MGHTEEQERYKKVSHLPTTNRNRCLVLVRGEKIFLVAAIILSMKLVPTQQFPTNAGKIKQGAQYNTLSVL